MGGEEGGVTGELDSLTDMYDSLPPLEKLERYFQSEDVLDRYCMCVSCTTIGICHKHIIACM